MSKILSKELKRKHVVYKTVRTLEGVRCDICKRVIPADKRRHLENRYFEVVTGHNDWGADSGLSRAHRDICPLCIGGFLSGYLAEASGTDYVEVETSYVFGQDVFDEEDSEIEEKDEEDDYVDPSAGTPWSFEQMEKCR